MEYDEIAEVEYEIKVIIRMVRLDPDIDDSDAQSLLEMFIHFVNWAGYGYETSIRKLEPPKENNE